jgi:TolB protein
MENILRSPAVTLVSTAKHWKLAGLLLCLLAAPLLRAQDDPFHLEATNANDRIRIAVADFKPAGGDVAGFKRTFDTTLFADLNSAGIFDIVSKSQLPTTSPGGPGEINLAQWSAAPSGAGMVAFGSFGTAGGKLVVKGYLDDTKNAQFPQVFGKQYTDEPSDDAARQIAHKFADEIISRLGGGIIGIAETKIYYVKYAGPNKEIWAMDYDGANQHALTHLGTVSLSPRVSPDNSRLAFSALGREGFQIKMYSLLLNRMVAFTSGGGTNLSPAWAPTGNQLAFSSSRTGDPEIWTADANGNVAHRVTSFRGPDVSPVYNPRTGAQIAWISGRTGLPQLYIMDVDGSGVQRMTDGGYATSPSWSPNGQFLAFAWNRKYGPGAPGGQDIYIMEVSTKRWIQLTHEIGRCDFPSWSPDGRHIVFANTPNGSSSSMRIMSMLADGTQKRALTGSGADMPNWSWK